MAQYNLYKGLSSFFFGCNYAGVLYGAFTFMNESEEKKKVIIYLESIIKLVIFDNCCKAFNLCWKQLLNPFIQIFY